MEYRVDYDLGACPASWDFLNWLQNVEIQRRNDKGGPLRVRFVPGPQDGFRADGLARPLDQREAILNNVMRPALRLIGAEETTEPPTHPSPTYAIKYAVDHVKRGGGLPRWTIPAESMAEAATWLVNNGLHNPVVITLREAAYYQERNSNLAAWQAFARKLEENVVFVRDTARAEDDFTDAGFLACPRASKDFLFRAALMAHAKANLMVSNGPIGIAQYLEVPWLQFKPLVPNLQSYAPAQPAFWTNFAGIGAGGQYPWGSPQHAIIWAEDTLEHIESAWAVSQGFPDPHPLKKIGVLQAVGVMTEDERMENVRANIPRVKKRVDELKGHNGVAILCCYGPSLKNTWKLAKEQRHSIPNAKIVSVSGAHDFLVQHHLIPNFHVECDPRAHKADMVTKPKHKTTYLLASCVHPKLVKRLHKHDVALWHLLNGEESKKIFEIEKRWPLVGGGGSVGLRAINVLYCLGFRKFIIHGMDCSFSQVDPSDPDRIEQHAGFHTGKTQAVKKVQVNGKKEFWTAPVQITYARTFIELVNEFTSLKRPPQDRCEFLIEGDGMLQAMLQEGMEMAKMENAA